MSLRCRPKETLSAGAASGIVRKLPVAYAGRAVDGWLAGHGPYL